MISIGHGFRDSINLPSMFEIKWPKIRDNVFVKFAGVACAYVYASRKLKSNNILIDILLLKCPALSDIKHMLALKIIAI